MGETYAADVALRTTRKESSIVTALLYGATGYTGGLILEECLARGLRPILSGRSQSVQELADAHGLDARVRSLLRGRGTEHPGLLPSQVVSRGRVVALPQPR